MSMFLKNAINIGASFLVQAALLIALILTVSVTFTMFVYFGGELYFHLTDNIVILIGYTLLAFFTLYLISQKSWFFYCKIVDYLFVHRT